MRSTTGVPVLREISRPPRIYGASALKAARHFWTARAEAMATELADALRKEAGAEAVVVLGDDDRILGLVRREELFALLGKPFGREILGRIPVREIAAPVEVHDASIGLFALAALLLESSIGGERFAALADPDGAFRGAISARDLADYLSRMTQEDVELAGLIQERLMASNEEKEGSGWSLEAWSRPAKGVGGDFWVSRRIGSDRVLFALCDVSGKGVSASLVVSLLWGMIAMCDFSRGLAPLLTALNEALASTFHLERYVTGFFTVLDEERRILEFADMGHSHALLQRGSRWFRPQVRQANLPLGVEPHIAPALGRVRLLPGDALLVYSDGISEQEGEEGREFGEERLLSLARKALANDRGLAELVPPALNAFSAGLPQQDDMSFLLLRLGAAPPSGLA